MPMPNFHAARIRQPGLFVEGKIREIAAPEGGAIRLIGGRLKSDPDGAAVVQAIRFDEDKYTAAEARAWLKKHDYSPISFEAATKNDHIDSREVFRIDTMPLGKMARGEDGSLRGDAVITRAGVFLYRGPNGETIREFRSPDEVFKADSLASAGMLPVTVEHPKERKVTPENAKRVMVGMTGERVRQDGANVVAPIRVWSQDGIDAIQQGRRQLSCGYRAVVDRVDGVYEGESYDHVQRDIRYNHLAFTHEGRAGAAAAVHLDSADAIMVTDTGADPSGAPPGKGQAMPLAQLRIDSGVSYEVPAEVEAAYNAKVKALNEASTKVDSLTAERDTLKADVDKITAQRDEAKAALDKAQKTDHADAIKAGVKARMGIVSAAHKAKLDKAVIEKLDSMSDDEIRLAVIQSRHKDFSAEGKSADYVVARFDAVVEAIGHEKDQGKTIVGDGSGDTRTDAGDTCTTEEARAKALDAEKKRSRGEK